MATPDTKFDTGQLDEISALAADRNVRAVTLRDTLRARQNALREAFQRDHDVIQVVRGRAALIDAVLRGLWKRFELDSSPHALLAVGGYGRGELHPYSDIDIAILLSESAADTFTRGLEGLITLLWDIGLEIGQSVRTIAESVAAAESDITIATNLMEARPITGNPTLFEQLEAALAPANVWPVDRFFTAKINEQQARHGKTNSALQRLEPNIKESPGGLRDIQVICWVANRHFRSRHLAELVDHGFLTRDEYEILQSGREFLWQIRTMLHYIAGRREDRLSFDMQKTVAAQFGHEDDGTNRPVEEFMKRYYRTVRELSQLNDLMLSLFNEAIIELDRTAEIILVNRRFQIRNNQIEARDEYVFRRTPNALLEIFLLIQQHPKVTGVRASTIRAIRENVHRIDKSFREDIRARSLFMEIMRQPQQVGHELQRMHRYGVLERYLPVIAKITGLMQFDLFHVYTVDEHALFVVRNLRRFLYPETPEDDIPLCREAMERIPKLELLYVAGLFHDIAKGRGGDHSELGADDAIKFCRDHGLGHWDTRLVAWLVRNHLVMSSTAQRKDISDPVVINEFADEVRDRVRLDYLYLLTVADIRGTNPELWTSWKAALLRQLFQNTAKVLRDNLEADQLMAQRTPEAQAEALALMGKAPFSEAEIRSFWNAVSDDYFYRHQPDEIAWHTSAVLNHGLSISPLVEVRNFPNRGGTAIFIYTPDREYLFSTITQVLDRLGLTIQDARIFTTGGGYAVDTFIVLEAQNNRPVDDPHREIEIANGISAALSTGRMPAERLRMQNIRRLQNFAIPVEVTFTPDISAPRTVMTVVATDRPGFLSIVGRAMQQTGVRLQNARIATLGERVEDVFYITDYYNEPVDDLQKQEQLREAIRSALADAP
ncbi:MAG: [protein-PII] uridylyltransferase [Gammaproteobacteria bacterium]|nr:[protein-PII] uridylyltransferase [Gammaproteobacteria bacterium]